ncbi:hypothetical protein WR25_24464 [Diploscapter pachys]|uniref:60Kd inner membrane protein n=1 Tax=Diploscapter pachys TaxID=2018661 RepID=A0A2A2LJU8_9BILA|nr:hypothetical protein WR25_24464 [Diploscapter pachys]
MLSRAAVCCRVLPCSSAAPSLGIQRPKSLQLSHPLQPSRRHISNQLPSGIAPLFQYVSESYISVAVQNGIEALHTMGLPWTGSILATGLLLRLVTSPFHIYAEKLFAESFHARNFLTQQIKVCDKYRVEFTPNEAGNKFVMKTDNKEVIHAAETMVKEYVPQVLGAKGLQPTRIQNLKMCTVPVWIFSSFALRNIISADFHPSFPGHLWIPDLLQPDPLYILPILVGVFGYLNLWSQRKIYPVQKSTLFIKSYDFLLGFLTLFSVVIMAQLPACIPFYWLVVSISGMAQAQILRHPRVKKVLGIKRLPSDSDKPIRDLFLMRKQV